MDVSYITKKGGISVLPHEIKLITDEADAMYDARVLLPLSDEAILNQAAIGLVQPVVLKVRGNDAIPTDGTQRTKRGLVINALNGSHPYRGELASVRDAVDRLRASEVGKTIVGLCPSAVKLSVVVYRGDESEAYLAKAAANAIRAEDTIVERARKAQHMSQRLGKSNKEIAVALGCSEQTAARLVARDLDAPKTKKARAKTSAPSKAKVAAYHDKMLADPGFAGTIMATVFGWLRGKNTRAEVLTVAPELGKFIGAK